MPKRLEGSRLGKDIAQRRSADEVPHRQRIPKDDADRRCGRTETQRNASRRAVIRRQGRQQPAEEPDRVADACLCEGDYDLRSGKPARVRDGHRSRRTRTTRIRTARGPRGVAASGHGTSVRGSHANRAAASRVPASAHSRSRATEPASPANVASSESAVPATSGSVAPSRPSGRPETRRNRWTRVPSRCQGREPGSRSGRPRPDRKLVDGTRTRDPRRDRPVF